MSLSMSTLRSKNGSVLILHVGLAPRLGLGNRSRPLVRLHAFTHSFIEHQDTCQPQKEMRIPPYFSHFVLTRSLSE